MLKKVQCNDTTKNRQFGAPAAMLLEFFFYNSVMKKKNKETWFIDLVEIEFFYKD